MSLLMDALRRAEAEKKQAKNQAEAGVEEEDLAATVKLNRPPLPDEASSAADDTAPQRPAAIDSVGDFSIHAGIGGSEPASQESTGLQLEPLDDQRAETGSASSGDDDSHSTTRPTPQSVQAQLDRYFDEPQAIDDSQTAGAGRAGDDHEELPAGQTAVNPYTVFEAGTSGISGRMIAWAVALGVAFLSVLVVAGFYYFQQAPTTRDIPSPDVVKHLQPINPATSEAPLRAPLQTSEPQTEFVAETGAPDVQQETTTNTGSTVDTQASAALDPASPEVDAATARTPETAVAAPIASEPATEVGSDATVPFEFDPAPTVHAKSVKISRTETGAKVDALNERAYQAYRNDDFATAKSLYGEALALRPDNTDALNGIAAVALRDGDVESAHRHYAQVLDIDPANATASAGLFQIEGGAGNRVTESHLKLMLDQGSDPGHINFALGNLYARNGRWNDAQLAFFEAVRHQPKNPDYLYNLAVSLDQIGQRVAARDFYQQALDAVDDNKPGFDPALVLGRIQSIGATAASGIP